MACGILIPQQGIELGPWAVKAQSPNHWTARDFPVDLFSSYQNYHPKCLWNIVENWSEVGKCYVR